jgi:hypothetical protein
MLKPIFSSRLVPAPIKHLYYYMKSSTHLSGSSNEGKAKNYNELSNDEFPPTIGGTTERRARRNGQKDPYPLQSFNTTVGSGTVNKGGSLECGHAG